MNPLRVVAFVPYPLGSTPSQRFRLEQWAPVLATQGFSVEFVPFATPDLSQLLYKRGATFAKARGIVSASLSLARKLPPPGRFDVAVVHRAMCLVGPAILEKRLAAGTPLVYDFDDAIHMLHTSDVNRAFGWLKFPAKTATICGLANEITVGNEFLATFARRHGRNVTVVPSSVDVGVYAPGPKRPLRDHPVVGWMGSSTSQTYLEPFAPLLAKLAREGLVVRIVSDRKPAFDFPCEWKAWSARDEVSDLQDFDIGIMPLPDTEWAKGKCAMKILQYMGVAVPSIGSAIGGNLEVVDDGQNGFLASTEDEWLQKTLRLARDPELSARLGRAGRVTVESRFSSAVCARKFGESLRRAASSRQG